MVGNQVLTRLTSLIQVFNLNSANWTRVFACADPMFYATSVEVVTLVTLQLRNLVVFFVLGLTNNAFRLMLVHTWVIGLPFEAIRNSNYLLLVKIPYSYSQGGDVVNQTRKHA